MRHPRNPRGSGEKGSQHKGFRTTCIRGGYHTHSAPLWTGFDGLAFPNLISFVRLPSPMDRLEIAKGVEATRDFALLLRDERALVISDLHLGFEGALAEQGVSIPRFQRRVILERLGQMFDRTKAEQVIIAGDFKHEFSKNLVDEWVEVKQVLRFIRDRAKPVLVRGNHDNYLATILGDLNLPLNARADEKEGLLDFGPVSRLKSIRGALLMK